MIKTITRINLDFHQVKSQRRILGQPISCIDHIEMVNGQSKGDNRGNDLDFLDIIHGSQRNEKLIVGGKKG